MTKTHNVLCFGEVLWDCLPRGLFMGGAPCNVAYHLQQSGITANPVTAVGQDFLGHEIVRRIKNAGLSDQFVQTIPDKMTGVVQVQINELGNAKYDITEDVAWDYISLAQGLEEAAIKASAIVFGSLAQRSLPNRAVLGALLHDASDAMKVFDVNLRPPFDDLHLVQTLCSESDLIKMNGDELKRLTGTSSNDLEKHARKFAELLSGKDKIFCITDGANGAGLLIKNKWLWEKAKKIEVKDTVGAGDSFLAALISELLHDKKPAEALVKACRLGDFVASSDGAMPSYKWEDIG
ncbi:MAG: carbohydrate kinase [Verrucomicrobiota bacterium]